MTENTTLRLQRCLDRLQGGDSAARDELVSEASLRLRRLAAKMLEADGRLQRWEETDDVCQNAVIRLCRALQSVTPANLREFFRLAALQVRRELIDLAHHHYGPEGGAAHHESHRPREGEGPPRALDPADWSHEPSALAVWGELHEKVSELPEEEREVFDLLYYQGLPHAEAAEVLGVSTKTVQRRWHRACLVLHERMNGELPPL